MPNQKVKSSPDPSSDPAVFCLEIDFRKSSGDPSRVFRTVAALIGAFEQFDKDISGSLDQKLEPVLYLENIEGGSIRAWFSNKLKEIPDEELKTGEPKRLLGLILVKAKHQLIKFCDGKAKVSSPSEIDDLRRSIVTIASEHRDQNKLKPVQIQRTHIIKALENMTGALANLEREDRAIYRFGEVSTSFNLEFSFVTEEIEELLTKKSLSNENDMILKVKKPDYLGDSMWEFRHGRTRIDAPIMDQDWLREFQSRKIDVRPGDSLIARVRVTVNYDYDNNVISTKYSILLVTEVLRLEPGEQGYLELDN